MKKLNTWFVILTVFLLAGFVPVMQGIQRFVEIRTETIKNSKTITSEDLVINDDMTLAGDLTGVDHFIGRSTFIRIQDADAAPSIRAAATVVATVSAVTEEILGIQYPRNLSITYVTVTTATAGSITVVGVDARGLAATELIAVAAISGSQTLTGVVPWQSVTSLTLPTRAEDVTLTVAGGKLFGLPYVPAAAADVYHLTVNKTPAVPTVDTTYGTFDPVATPAANVDYDVLMKQ
jgi:hypothetical protein